MEQINMSDYAEAISNIAEYLPPYSFDGMEMIINGHHITAYHYIGYSDDYCDHSAVIIHIDGHIHHRNDFNYGDTVESLLIHMLLYYDEDFHF